MSAPACPDLAPALAARSLGLLEPDATRALDGHLVACAPCRSLAEAALAKVAPDADAPADPAAWERLRARLEAEATEGALASTEDPLASSKTPTGSRVSDLSDLVKTPTATRGGEPASTAPAITATPVTATATTAATTRITAIGAAVGSVVAVGGAPSPAIRVACTFCHGELVRADAVYCASCLAPHHLECFREHARCSAAGCGGLEVVRPARPDDLLERPRRPRWRVLERLAVRVPVLLGVAACTWGLFGWDLLRARFEVADLTRARDEADAAIERRARANATDAEARDEAARLERRIVALRDALAGRTAPLQLLEALGRALPRSGPDLPPGQDELQLRRTGAQGVLSEAESLLRGSRLEEHKLWLVGLRLTRSADRAPGAHELALAACVAYPFAIFGEPARDRRTPQDEGAEQRTARNALRERVRTELARPLDEQLAATRLRVSDLDLGVAADVFQLDAGCRTSPGPDRELRGVVVPVGVVVDPDDGRRRP